jgi:hypothetical protein
VAVLLGDVFETDHLRLVSCGMAGFLCHRTGEAITTLDSNALSRGTRRIIGAGDLR